VPALATPCALTKERLPIGLQLTAPWLEEARLVRVAHAFEQDLRLDAAPPLAGEG
jgi:Asp-tRNA(Asn)/Glu-tRNA(Gln) amidotransferase A subunit family amidase